eukprot:g2520.t1
MILEAGTDLVDSGMFLRGCEEPLEQYRECLMKNLKDWNGRGLHRGKLADVKIHQLGQMNIRRFDHQKLIMDRIRQLPDIPSMPRYCGGKVNTAELEAAVHMTPSSARKDSGKRNSIGNVMGTSNGTLSGASSSASVGAASGNLSDESSSADGTKSAKGRNRRNSTRHGIGVKGGRRGSMAIDKSWEAINKARSQADGGEKQKQLNNIRRRKSQIGTQPPELKPFNPANFASDQKRETGNDSVVTSSSEANSGATAAGGGSRRGSISLNNPDKDRQAKIDAAKAKRQRAMEYGNSALKATTREGQLKDLKKQASRACAHILADFVDTIGCDRATLMFVDTPSQELFFFDGSARIAFPIRKGIAGHCAATGMGVVVNDPYNNEYFNRQIDKDSGFMTRNILCEPIKSRKGGNVVAVLQMVNKKDGQDFTEQDAGVMEMCAVRVALALDTSFAALVKAENEWAKTAGRRRSTGGSVAGSSKLSTAAEAAAAAATATAEVEAQRQNDENAIGGRRASLVAGRRGSAAFGGGAAAPEVISNRRGSGTSKADVEKLKRRTDYGKEGETPGPMILLLRNKGKF